MSLDHYLTTEPEDRQNALTAEEPDICSDCGDTPCTCDARCWKCGCVPQANDVDFPEMGVCLDCRIDAVAGY